MTEAQGSSSLRPPAVGRPAMPGDYGLAPASGGEILPWGWAVQRLEASRNYWVATVRPDGRPHAMPVWGVWFAGAFYFGTGAKSRKARNLAADPRAVVHLESGDEVVVLEGIMAEVTDDADLDGIGDALTAKYEVEMDLAEMGAVVYRMAPQVAFGWTEESFPQTATRWVFGESGAL